MAIFLCGACFYACGDNDSDDDSGGSMNAGTCDYINPFFGEPECREYSGNAWTADSAQEHCGTEPMGLYPPAGDWSETAECELETTLGTCDVPDLEETDLEFVLHIGGDDDDDCVTAADNCAGFLAGTFTNSEICDAIE